MSELVRRACEHGRWERHGGCMCHDDDGGNRGKWSIPDNEYESSRWVPCTHQMLCDPWGEGRNTIELERQLVGLEGINLKKRWRTDWEAVDE